MDPASESPKFLTMSQLVKLVNSAIRSGYFFYLKEREMIAKPIYLAMSLGTAGFILLVLLCICCYCRVKQRTLVLPFHGIAEVRYQTDENREPTVDFIRVRDV